MLSKVGIVSEVIRDNPWLAGASMLIGCSSASSVAVYTKIALH